MRKKIFVILIVMSLAFPPVIPYVSAGGGYDEAGVYMIVIDGGDDNLLTVYSGPGMSFPTTVYLRVGSMVRVTHDLVQADNYEWLRIQGYGIQGWVRMRDQVADVSTLEVASEDLLQQYVREATNALSQDPNNAHILHNRALSHYNLGGYWAAINDLQQVLTLEPENIWAMNHIGLAYMAFDDPFTAINYLSWAIGADTSNLALYSNLYTAYLHAGQYQDAMDTVNRAALINENFATTFNNRGYLNYQLGNYEAAFEDLSLTIELDPDYAFAYNTRGLVYKNYFGDYAAAEQDFKTSIAKDSSYPHALINLANLYTQLGTNYEEAESLFWDAIYLAPDDIDGYRGLGNLYIANEEYELLLEAIDEWWALYPYIDSSTDLFLVFRADAYFHLGRYTESKADIDYLISIYPNDAWGYAARCELYITLSDFPNALTDCTYAIELDPSFAYGHYAMGMLYVKQQDYESAIESYTQALELDYEYLEVYKALGDVYYQQGKYEEAYFTYQMYLIISEEPDETIINRIEEIENLIDAESL